MRIKLVLKPDEIREIKNTKELLYSVWYSEDRKMNLFFRNGSLDGAELVDEDGNLLAEWKGTGCFIQMQHEDCTYDMEIVSSESMFMKNGENRFRDKYYAISWIDMEELLRYEYDADSAIIDIAVDPSEIPGFSLRGRVFKNHEANKLSSNDIIHTAAKYAGKNITSLCIEEKEESISFIETPVIQHYMVWYGDINATGRVMKLKHFHVMGRRRPDKKEMEKFMKDTLHIDLGPSEKVFSIKRITKEEAKEYMEGEQVFE